MQKVALKIERKIQNNVFSRIPVQNQTKSLFAKFYDIEKAGQSDRGRENRKHFTTFWEKKKIEKQICRKPVQPMDKKMNWPTVV